MGSGAHPGDGPVWGAVYTVSPKSFSCSSCGHWCRRRKLSKKELFNVPVLGMSTLVYQLLDTLTLSSISWRSQEPRRQRMRIDGQGSRGGTSSSALAAGPHIYPSPAQPTYDAFVLGVWTRPRLAARENPPSSSLHEYARSPGPPLSRLRSGLGATLPPTAISPCRLFNRWMPPHGLLPTPVTPFLA
ncbi:hypothetical protein FS749_001622 [Ceratobasidium sp. UAMH 11750]|nr:hypothetical protein FS749_001622 [Ceratobasidium sp. UAMH 11750]